MKKRISITFLATMVAFVLCACAGKVDYDELKSHNEVMFKASMHNCGENDLDEDYWQSTNYSVYYDGTIDITEVYNLRGEIGVKTTISDKEYEKIYAFASNGKIDKEVDGVDGVSWDFHYFDLEGNHTLIYSGYTYGIEEIEAVQEILMGYQFVD